jgi:hypothetical protein
MGDYRVENAVLVIGGTAVLDAPRGHADDLVLRHLHQTRFANPRLPAQHHDVALARLDLRPPVPQEPHFGLAAHQRREAAGRRDVEALLHLGHTHDLMDLEGHGHPFERLGSERAAGEIPLDEPLRRRTDEDRIGCRQPLEAGRNVRRVPQRELFLPPPAAYLPHDDDSGVNPHADREVDARPLAQAAVEGGHRLHDAQAGPHRTLRVVFMRLRVAEIDQEPVAEILRNMPLKALDNLGTGGLVRAHYLPQVFGIKLRRQRGRRHQVTEQDRELAPFRVSCRRDGLVCRRRRRLGGRGGSRVGASRPAQAAPCILLHLRVGVEQFLLQRVERLVLEMELELERPIRHTLTLTEEGNHLIEDGVKVHRASPAQTEGNTHPRRRPSTRGWPRTSYMYPK